MSKETAWALALEVHDPKPETLKAWKRRGLPWQVIAQTMDEAQRRGQPLSLKDFGRES